MRSTILLLSFLLTLFTLTFGQKKIAVLPYKITYEGRIPKKYTAEDITRLQIIDGKNYQASMINSLTRTNMKKKNLRLDVEILSQGQLDALLASKGLSYEQLETMTNEKIQDTLNITHIVRGSAVRNFIMSDELSLGSQRLVL